MNCFISILPIAYTDSVVISHVQMSFESGGSEKLEAIQVWFNKQLKEMTFSQLQHWRRQAPYDRMLYKVKIL